MTKIKPNTIEVSAEVTTNCNTGINPSPSSTTNANNQQRNEKSRAGQTGGSNTNYDLRPKFAILKHKSEFLTQTTKESSNARPQVATTPAWFFNIPTTRSPFPDFGNHTSAPLLTQMAQTLQQQDSRDSSTSTDNNPPIQFPTNKDALKTTCPGKSSTTTATGLGATNSSSLIPTQIPLFNRHQPSKVFITKCHTELESLLESIKDNYHEEIKSLYTDELYTDFFVKFGEEPLNKPLHKCIIASRAYKLYKALKTFKVFETPIEQDIIISEFQGKKQDKDNSTGERNGTDLQESAEDTQSEILDEETKEISIFHCELPENLISPALFLNFVRRVYLDQDVTEEEIKLNQCLIDWLKLNKPELIRVSIKHSPDHKESFRTILPDFEELSIAKSPVMSFDQSTNLGDDIESNVDDIDETSQSNSIKDESLTGSLLTRTETFELVSKSTPDSPPIVTPSKNILAASQNDDEKGDGTSNTENSSIPSSYAPMTRTGLKPKTFTTPTGMRTARATPTTAPTITTGNKQTQAASKPNPRDEFTKIKTVGATAPRGSLTKQSSSGSSVTPTTKCSNLTEAKPDTQSKHLVNKTKTTAIAGLTGKGKPITRAQPISMERSQSPGTNVIKSTGRNFIVANKRLVAQMEKKLTAQADHPNYDSENEISDTSSFALEPLTSDNLIAQMDKFALVSCSKLADALSRMFIDGILSDAIILVKDGKQINAHKCILAARSAYLAEFINKQSLVSTTPESSPSNGDRKQQQLKIDLTEFSYPAVYFSIMHIYSGIVKVPDDLDLDELTKLSHLLHVNTLRKVCMHNLRMNYCHFFHKPCNVCCLGVLKTLPLAWRYDYTELYTKCLQWIGSHFASIFCLKEFSELKPHDLLEECYSATLSQLTPDNIIPKTIECQKLLKHLPRVKWTESIICLVGRQLEDFCHYVADNYEKILQSESFLNLGKNCWECEILEENLLAAMNHLKPDSGCKTMIQLHKIECSIESYSEDPRNVSDSFANLVSKMRKYCERYLLKEAAAVVHCSSWRHMNPALQKRIKDQAIISTDFDEPTKHLASKPKLPSMSRVITNQQSVSPQASNSSSSDSARSPSNRSTPESRLKSPSTTYLPPPKNKTAAARHVKVFK